MPTSPPASAPAQKPAPAADGEALRSRFLGIRWPLLLQAPERPRVAAPIDYDDETSPARFTGRVIFGAKKFTIPGGLLLILSNIAGAGLPVIAGLAVDRGIATDDLTQLALWTTLLVAEIMVMSLCFRLGSRMGFFGMQTVQHRLRMQVTERLRTRRGCRDASSAAPCSPPPPVTASVLLRRCSWASTRSVRSPPSSPPR